MEDSDCVKHLSKMTKKENVHIPTFMLKAIKRSM